MKAWELIADPKRWTQERFARDATGSWVHPESGSAVCWCAKGALLSTYRGKSFHIGKAIYRRYRQIHGTEIPDDNDSPEMTAAVMSERLRVAEEEVLSKMPSP